MSAAQEVLFPKPFLAHQKVNGRRRRAADWKSDAPQMTALSVSVSLVLADALRLMCELAAAGESQFSHHNSFGPEYLGELLLDAIVPRFPSFFGIEYADYARRVARGERVDLKALHEEHVEVEEKKSRVMVAAAGVWR